jgi:hypothetical protein
MRRWAGFWVVLLFSWPLLAAEPFSQWRDALSFDPVIYNFDLGNFAWTIGNPLIDPPVRAGDTVYSVKEPSVVRVGERNHLFCVTRGANHNHQVEYLTFKDWNQANKAERVVLDLGTGDFSSPQIFYFSPRKKWYLILQAPDKAQPAQMLPYFSTNNDVADPKGWSRPEPLIAKTPQGVRLWRDFWVICDNDSAYLFATGRDGRMWRCETNIDDFPAKWDAPLDILKGDFMAAARIYKIGTLRESRYLAIIESMEVGRRYYKAFTAQYLDAGWNPLAPNGQPPPAMRTSLAAIGYNVTRPDVATNWTDSISHAEILRSGIDETMEIDPHNWRMVFNGMKYEDKAGKGYREVSWRIGMLSYKKPPPIWEK